MPLKQYFGNIVLIGLISGIKSERMRGDKDTRALDA